ncbi:Hypothetical predicted protein [Mytilus galloprovincialis]|uniref:Uncharacterized protein n=1 Tax=Mytilus galloprovincialis TaxID=29158 RepID=A0A8B6DDK6_MYTGA|nr:Hypothetical predicted protein [Mytilus galloprovincialis]
MIEVQLNQQPRLVGEHCTEYESSTAMKEQHFENSHLNDRFQQTVNPRNRTLQPDRRPSKPRQQAVQLPVEHIINHNQQRQQAVQLPVEHNDNYLDQILEPFNYLVVTQSPTHNQLQQPIQQSTRHTIKQDTTSTTGHIRAYNNCLLNQVSTGHLQLLSINQSTTGLQVNNHLNPPSTGQTLYLHIGLLHPSGKGNLVNNHHRPSTGPINHPVPGQQVNYSQLDNKTIPFQ